MRNKLTAYLLILIVVVYTTACGAFSKTDDSVLSAYKAIRTQAELVDSVRSIYHKEFYKKGKVTPEMDADVDKYYQLYQQAMTVAIQTYKITSQLKALKAAPEEPKQDITITNYRRAINDFFAALGRAGMKVKPIKVED